MSSVDDQVLGFPAFPPGRRGGRRFARTWWGDAWIAALEDNSLAIEPLRKGRRYAVTGHVGSITVSPGLIAASVHDGDTDTPYRTRVAIEQLTDAAWGRLLDQVAAKAGHIAALLAGQMPQDLLQAADAADVSLLPGLGELQPDCDCPDWEHPCRHAAALCFQVSWLLDADPFLLMLMRGRGRGQLLEQLMRRQGQVESDGEAKARGPVGVTARQAYGARPVPLPQLDLPTPVGAVPALPDGDGVDARALEALIADAAARAASLLERSAGSLPKRSAGATADRV